MWLPRHCGHAIPDVASVAGSHAYWIGYVSRVCRSILLGWFLLHSELGGGNSCSMLGSIFHLHIYSRLVLPQMQSVVDEICDLVGPAKQ